VSKKKRASQVATAGPGGNDLTCDRAISSEIKAAAAPRQLTMPIADIRVGKRIRKVMGDVAGLADDMADLGQLQPIVVSPEGKLLAGERRLRAAELLGWKTIDVVVRRKANGQQS
jgi:hypothetical protein